MRHLHSIVFCTVLLLFCGGWYLSTVINSHNLNAETANPAALEVEYNYPTLPPIFYEGNLANINKVTFPDDAMLLQYKAAYEKNNDLAGWLEIKDIMSLPIMYTPNDGEFYLTHYFDKSKQKYGTPFIDARCSFNPKSDNIIIHGHNMNDATMFSPLMKYKSESFYNSNKSIIFNTLFEESTYEIYSVFISNFDKANNDANNYFNIIDLPSQDIFDGFVDDVGSRSLYKTDVTPSYGDSFITLMTCTNTSDSERMNIVAVKSK